MRINHRAQRSPHRFSLQLADLHGIGGFPCVNRLHSNYIAPLTPASNLSMFRRLGCRIFAFTAAASSLLRRREQILHSNVHTLPTV
jgi:hypothetical protein